MTIEDYDLLFGGIRTIRSRDEESQMKRLEEIETGTKSFEKDGFEFDVFEDEAIIMGISQPMADIIIPDFVEHNDMKYKVTCICCSFVGNEYRTLALGSNVKYIGSWCFSGCKMLQEVKLNNCLEVIGESAFYSTPINEVVIPESIKRLDDDAFYNCIFLTVYLPKRLQAGANFSFGGTPLVERVFHHVAFIHYYDESDNITDNMELLPLKRMQDIFDSCSHYAFDIILTYMNLSNQNWDSNQTYYMGHPDMRAKRYVIRRKSTNEEIYDYDNDPIIATYESMEKVLLDGWKLDSVIKYKNDY